MTSLKKVCFLSIALVLAMTSATFADVIMDATHLNGSFNAPDVSGYEGGYKDGQAPAVWQMATAGTSTSFGLADGTANPGYSVDAGQGFYASLSKGQNVESNWLWQSNVYTIASAGEVINMSYYIANNHPANLGGSGLVRGALQLDSAPTGYAASTGYVVSVGISTLGGANSLQTLSYTTTAADVGHAITVSLDFYNPSASNYSMLKIDCVTVGVTPVPEPSTVALAISGLIGLLAYAWRKRK